MGEIIVVCTVIFILLLFLIPITIHFEKNEKTTVKLKIFFIPVKLPQIKGKGIKIKNIKNNVSPLYCGIKYLLGYSRVRICVLEFLTVFDLAEKPYLSCIKFISISSLLAFVAANSREYDYDAKRYIVTERKDAQKTKITFTASFLLLRLIISLLLVAYYKIKNAIKERVEYV